MYLTGRARWAAIVVFAAVTAAGAVRLNPSAAAAAAGAVVAVGAAALLLLGWRPVLLYAALATAGIAVLGNGTSSNIGWFAVCLLAGWCVLAGTRREGLAYWAGAMLLFASEWLWGQPDPGWGAWLAGTTLTVAFSLLIRHDRDLLRRLRLAQAGLAEQARAQERNRIARELHDVIGHTLTVSLLHVQSARLAVEHDPADAGHALAEAERLGRECLAEVRTAVGMLREDDAADRDRAAAGRWRLARAGGAVPLGGRGRDADRRGRHRRASRHDRPGRVPHRAGGADERGQARTRGADRGRAAGRRAGEVTLTADSRTVPGKAASAGAGPGLGVISMRERAESVGGSCEAGPGGRGWLVRARLPLTGGTS